MKLLKKSPRKSRRKLKKSHKKGKQIGGGNCIGGNCFRNDDYTYTLKDKLLMDYTVKHFELISYLYNEKIKISRKNKYQIKKLNELIMMLSENLYLLGYPDKILEVASTYSEVKNIFYIEFKKHVFT